MSNSKRAIVMGGTSGIGREVAILLSQNGYDVAVAGRREELLKTLVNDNESIIDYQIIDITSDDATEQLANLIERIGGIDLYFHSSGIGYQNLKLDSEKEMRTVETNAVGFTHIINNVYHYFVKQGSGQIAAITSIAGTKGLGAAPAYSATKRFQNSYLEALSQLSRMKGADITFTDIRPGFVATDLLGDGATYPMKMSKHYVAKKVVNAVLRRRKVVVVDWRYAILVFFWRLVPRCIWTRMKISSMKE